MYPQYIKLNVDHDWPEATTAHTEAFETYWLTKTDRLGHKKLELVLNFLTRKMKPIP